MLIFCDRLLQLKTKNNLLQKDIAKELKISLRTYQRYESGEREPSLSTIINLADYFDVSIDYLTGRTENPEINK